MLLLLTENFSFPDKKWPNSTQVMQQEVSFRIDQLFRFWSIVIDWWALAMQSNFTSCVFASSCLALPKAWWNIFLITSENQLVRSPNFSVLTVFWCSTSCAVKLVPWKIILEPANPLACWWPCWCRKCVSSLWRPENNFKFLRCILVLILLIKFCSEINERIGIQPFFHFIVLVILVASFTRRSFFYLWVGFLGCSCLVAVLR